MLFRSIQFGSFKIKAKIDEARKEMSFYELLGIRETGNLPEIKQAYKQLARKYHPDVSPPDRVVEYTERFILVQEAYETLSDPSSRALYDRDLALGIHLAFSARRRYQYDEVFSFYFLCFSLLILALGFFFGLQGLIGVSGYFVLVFKISYLIVDLSF